MGELKDKEKFMHLNPDYGQDPSGMTAEDALHWLTIRFCINKDISKILDENDVFANKKSHVNDRQ